MNTTPTRRQKVVLEAVRSYRDLHGRPPTIRELCEATGLSSTSTVHAHIRALVKKGCIEEARIPGGPLRYDMPGCER